MLELKKRFAKIGGSANARTEKHGDEPVPMMDLPVEILLNTAEVNRIMNEPHTTDAWFQTSASELPEPFLKNVAPYKLRGKFEDCAATFILGVNSVEVQIKAAKFAGLTFEPQTGGMTQVKFKIQTVITNKTNELFLWLDREVDVELQFGDLKGEDKQADLDLQVPDDDKPLNTFEADEPAKKKRGRGSSRSATVN